MSAAAVSVVILRLAGPRLLMVGPLVSCLACAASTPQTGPRPRDFYPMVAVNPQPHLIGCGMRLPTPSEGFPAFKRVALALVVDTVGIPDTNTIRALPRDPIDIQGNPAGITRDDVQLAMAVAKTCRFSHGYLKGRAVPVQLRWYVYVPDH